MNEEIFYDLEGMLRRAFTFAREMWMTLEMAEFIQECQRLQHDILRPWERID